MVVLLYARGKRTLCSYQRQTAFRRKTARSGSCITRRDIPHTEQADIDVKTNYPHENRCNFPCAVYGENCSVSLYIPQGTKTCPFRSTGSHSAQLSGLPAYFCMRRCRTGTVPLLAVAKHRQGGFFSKALKMTICRAIRFSTKDTDRKLGFLIDHAFIQSATSNAGRNSGCGHISIQNSIGYI